MRAGCAGLGLYFDEPSPVPILSCNWCDLQQWRRPLTCRRLAHNYRQKPNNREGVPLHQLLLTGRRENRIDARSSLSVAADPRDAGSPSLMGATKNPSRAARPERVLVDDLIAVGRIRLTSKTLECCSHG
jgi:hypothetical protein